MLLRQYPDAGRSRQLGAAPMSDCTYVAAHTHVLGVTGKADIQHNTHTAHVHNSYRVNLLVEFCAPPNHLVGFRQYWVMHFPLLLVSLI